ncbi:Spy/CpxP family protein refolding chaperone [Lyngbya confervoides]|uniref:Spy/CpxP family protein refolding chaperone n=1 Tax=Lyngbya confervoides BDU141951 TaxID=1574623 RepID=A0ABD4T058_9CYAN|nr:Spy/CpxP family protein refolding chaperone [Lyngbya confervoides]MCM1982014.1 Spy/CpxP family protein refolding chaperone [Lyngbya confervoides BDU141951]
MTVTRQLWLVFSLVGCVAVSALILGPVPNAKPQAEVFLGQVEDGGRLRNRPQRREFLRSLNLSRSQIRELQQIRRDYQPRMRSQRQRLWEEREAFRQLLSSNASNAAVEDQFEVVQTLRQDLDRLRLESVTAMRSVLTPAQRQILADQRRQP